MPNESSWGSRWKIVSPNMWPENFLNRFVTEIGIRVSWISVILQKHLEYLICIKNRIVIYSYIPHFIGIIITKIEHTNAISVAVRWCTEQCSCSFIMLQCLCAFTTTARAWCAAGHERRCHGSLAGYRCRNFCCLTVNVSVIWCIFGRFCAVVF